MNITTATHDEDDVCHIGEIQQTQLPQPSQPQPSVTAADDQTGTTQPTLPTQNDETATTQPTLPAGDGIDNDDSVRPVVEVVTTTAGLEMPATTTTVAEAESSVVAETTTTSVVVATETTTTATTAVVVDSDSVVEDTTTPEPAATTTTATTTQQKQSELKYQYSEGAFTLLICLPTSTEDVFLFERLIELQNPGTTPYFLVLTLRAAPFDSNHTECVSLCP